MSLLNTRKRAMKGLVKIVAATVIRSQFQTLQALYTAITTVTT